MHPANHAATNPDKLAVIMAGSGKTMTYGELEAASNRGAHMLRSLGLERGDGIAVMSKNQIEYFVYCWAALRAGLYFTPLSTHLAIGEAAYIVNDSAAKVLILSPEIGAIAQELAADSRKLMPGLVGVYGAGSPIEGHPSWSDATAGFPETPIADQSAGAYMFYSSGTTGRPKGIKPKLAEGPYDAETVHEARIRDRYGAGPDSIYLSPAPLYHGAPTGFTTTMQRHGATVIVMEKFDPEHFLALIEKYKVTFTQVVPTMFIRLLKLPDDIRAKYDLSSLTCGLHAAAPCPVPVKHQMIEWWGPIIYEYYGGSEANGQTAISPEEWLRKPGSVGRANGVTIHICDEDGKELPVGEAGTIYFEGFAPFIYHNDPDKTAASRHPVHPTWSAIGDVGYVDEDGYLFLTDRAANMIISGGVNIYPQEIENALIMHPAVADVAVFGVPHEEMGEEVKAVVQPRDWDDAGPDLEAELIAFCRTQISHVKCPKSVDFERQLPRLDTGKLYKRLLKERYWADHRPASVGA